MKNIILAITFIATTLFSAMAHGGEIRATISQVGENTVVSCIPSGLKDISKATIILYESDGEKISVTRGEMELSADSQATYILPGTYMEVGGKCKFFTSQNDLIADINPGSETKEGFNKAEFYLSMK